MSKGADGRHIVCDGEGCDACAAIPVALRPMLMTSAQAASDSAGWLYIYKRSVSLHFCPSCARRYLESHYDGLEA